MIRPKKKSLDNLGQSWTNVKSLKTSERLGLFRRIICAPFEKWFGQRTSVKYFKGRRILTEYKHRNILARRSEVIEEAGRCCWEWLTLWRTDGPDEVRISTGVYKVCTKGGTQIVSPGRKLSQFHFCLVSVVNPERSCSQSGGLFSMWVPPIAHKSLKFQRDRSLDSVYCCFFHTAFVMCAFSFFILMEEDVLGR